MRKYYVTISGGTRRTEFEAAKGLLIERGLIAAGHGREYYWVRNGNGHEIKGLLHVWEEKDGADGFAEELNRLAGTDSWIVENVEVEKALTLDDVREWTKQHEQISPDELLLTVFYKSSRYPQDLSVIEVVENFGLNAISPERELFEVTYGPASEFPLEQDQSLRLVLTNPEEFSIAIRDKWPQAEDFREAYKFMQYELLHDTTKGRALLEQVAS